MSNSLNINEVRLAGVLHSDIDVKKNQTGHSYCRFNIGIESNALDSNNELYKKMEWTRCIALGDIALELANSCQAGTNLYVVGRIQSTVYNQGELQPKKEITEVVVGSFQTAAGAKTGEIDLDAQMLEEGGNPNNIVPDDLSETEKLPLF